MKRYIKSSQAIYAGYSCDGWFNILKNQKIPVSKYDDIPFYERKKIEHFDDDEWDWGFTVSYSSHPEYVEDGYDSIQRYTGGWDKSINNHLRGLPYENTKGLGNLYPCERADRIHQVVSKATLPKDIVTVRWADIDNLVAYLGEQAPENITSGDIEPYIGSIVTEKGFYSSSMSGKLNHPYYDSKSVQFITLLPKGTPAIYVWNHVSRKKNEYEILLLDGSSFIIRDIQYSENGFDSSTGLQSDCKYRIFMEKI